MPEQVPAQDYYTILNLHCADKVLDKKTVKQAYRRALLLHHPDKSSRNTKLAPTVDDLTIAYKTLIDPVARSDYDRSRILRSTESSAYNKSFHTGLETVDLDDLSYGESEGTWSRSCRCGNDRAYIIREEELEKNIEYGEIVTGCQGCSLWLRVTFAVAEDG